MFNPSFRKGMSAAPQVFSNITEDKMAAPNNAYYVLMQAHAGLPNSLLFDIAFGLKDTDDLAEGSSNLYYTNARVGAYVSPLYVPYTGAVSDVDLGSYNLTTTGALTTTGVGKPSKILTLPNTYPSLNNYALISSTAGVLSWNDQALLTTSSPSFYGLSTFTITPRTTNAYNLGSTGTGGKQWKNAYILNTYTETLYTPYITAFLSSDVNFGTNIVPVADDTYYLGQIESPFNGFKAVILKDTANGKHYKIEMINGVLTPTALD